MIKHSQITQSNKFAISLKYLKKEASNGGHFWHADKHQVSTNDYCCCSCFYFYAYFYYWKLCFLSLWILMPEIKFKLIWLGIIFLVEVTRHVQNTQNTKLVIFLQFIKKSCPNYVVLYCDAKHSDFLWGSSLVHCYLFKFYHLYIVCWTLPLKDVSF